MASTYLHFVYQTYMWSPYQTAHLFYSRAGARIIGVVSVVGNINERRFGCAVNANIFKASTARVAATLVIGDRWRVEWSAEIEGIIR